ncbi:MAG: AraC family transcriptional regulator, partial [Candidatus Solibacter sp.]|nr:AraC family transcriptional regulator [Candidatus Solibacter sp.]
AVHGHPVRPDGCMDVIYAPDSGLRVVGTMTVEQRFDLAAGAHAFGIRFRPGMAGAFLELNAAELTDRIIPLEDLWGRKARELASRIEDAPTLSAAARILSGALSPGDIAPDAVRRAIAEITSAHGEIDLDWVSRQSGLSARQFRRRCLDASGLTPKHLCRVLRFRRACELASAAGDWAEIAATAGYFDQSHLIRDFREFTGATPMSVFSKTEGATAG